ncbi:MAG UNVERIFIED_CONTAM: hypothetical protein LVR29_04055 [Microcystis novacekii LVE1205-3]
MSRPSLSNTDECKRGASLVPMVAIAEGELWAFQNPRVRESLKRGLAEARTGDFAEETVDLDAMLEFPASTPEEVEE